MIIRQLVKSGEKWLIVDAGNSGNLLITSLRGEYKKNADMTPLQYAEGLLKLLTPATAPATGPAK